ncbi:hypothetical protein NLI96_g8499 [Meripilus lineatus]|uniref:EF-hand domain-containing protein n=1 Tax=Meripilus lineatus TaxID=2056292 RepID=A0AAD5UX88_9APHY|nr:hypothetical protein NLI96_g8499 [Physisporinus lineatus]
MSSLPYQERKEDRMDSMSIHSDSPLHRLGSPPAQYPPPLPSQAQFNTFPQSHDEQMRHVPSPAEPMDRPFLPYDNERAQTMPLPSGHERRPGLGHGGHHSSNSRNGSWDLLAGIRKFEHSYEEFDSRNASASHLAFADGDMPNNKLAKFYNYLLNVSIFTRWFLFIVPVLALLWIPGILGITTFPNAEIWGVKLVWWSIWFSVAWVVWVSFQPLINTRQRSDASSGSVQIVNTIAKLLFAFFLCAAVLAFEKFSIQWIAGKFHERSYAERIAAQKFAVRVLVTLYRHSNDIPGRSDTLRDGPMENKRATMNPRKILKKALKGVRSVATTTTTALGNVASEIAGSSVLQPNSPQAMVQTALESANKTRLLARRLFYSFARPGSEYLIVEDMARFFPTPDDADEAFAIFDKDSNGDATRDEVEMACLEFHREQLSIEHSMRDLDSAVGRLDNILMSVYFIVAILIIAVALEAQLISLITGAGTLILGLSWLIGNSLSEVLTSIIFLFIKHPYDVGDRVTVEEEVYTVKEIRLLSTIFLDKNTCSVQAPNMQLNEKSYSTSFDQIEQLRELMLAFLKSERRDYQAVFDVLVVDIPDQEKMTLRADIKYKSNWQQGALKAKRRNKWICALKSSLAQVSMFGPSGDPDVKSGPKEYTLVPWEEVKRASIISSPMAEPQAHPGGLREPTIPPTYTFTDQSTNAFSDSEDVFGDANELRMTNPQRTLDQPGIRHRPPITEMPNAVTMPNAPRRSSSVEEIELTTPRAANFSQV